MKASWYFSFHLPHTEDDILTKFTITALDANDNTVKERVFENIPVTRNTYSFSVAAARPPTAPSTSPPIPIGRAWTATRSNSSIWLSHCVLDRNLRVSAFLFFCPSWTCFLLCKGRYLSPNVLGIHCWQAEIFLSLGRERVFKAVINQNFPMPYRR